MDARLALAAMLAATLSLGANYRTENFIVTADSQSLARKVAHTAESQRKDLATKWLGRELPQWISPCPIRVHVGRDLGAGGATSFAFQNGQPVDWRMTIQGNEARLLDSVLPHEITHMVFATHFGRPLPRWADEGACTTVEHVSERRAQHDYLIEFLNTERGIAFNRMFAMREYPADVMPLYSQGFSVSRFLIQHGEEEGSPHSGNRKFVRFLGQGMASRNWSKAVRNFYGYKDLSDLQVSWLKWVKSGSPKVAVWLTDRGAALASARSTASEAESRGELASRSSTRSSAVQFASASASESTNYYVKQARLATNRVETKSDSRSSTQAATERPEGERKILLEWRGEPKSYRWTGANDRVIR